MVAEPITDKSKGFKAVPIIEPVVDTTTPDAAPKRRGRPPGSKNATVAEGAPRRGRKPRSMVEPIGGLLVTANLPLMMFASGDALDAVEIDALAKAIDAQCQTSPRFRKYVQNALEASSGGQLILVVGMIAARRASRHGFILPREADDAIGAAMAGNVTALMGMMPQPDKEPEQPTNGTTENA